MITKWCRGVQTHLHIIDKRLQKLIPDSGSRLLQDMWQRTPLHYAAREGHLHACQRLVEVLPPCYQYKYH